MTPLAEAYGQDFHGPSPTDFAVGVASPPGWDAYAS